MADQWQRRRCSLGSTNRSNSYEPSSWMRLREEQSELSRTFAANCFHEVPKDLNARQWFANHLAVSPKPRDVRELEPRSAVALPIIRNIAPR
jgi:hypothetical protein